LDNERLTYHQRQDLSTNGIIETQFTANMNVPQLIIKIFFWVRSQPASNALVASMQKMTGPISPTAAGPWRVGMEKSSGRLTRPVELDAETIISNQRRYFQLRAEGRILISFFCLVPALKMRK
jgi:hypothetical protein